MRFSLTTGAGLILAQIALGAGAETIAGFEFEPGAKLQVQVSPFTYHYSYDEKHRQVHMVGLERERVNGKLDGVTFFTNSFGQPSVYIYPWGGAYNDLGGIKALSFKWTAGLLYGYVAPYENKVPYDHNGFSPGAIVALAYEFKPGWSAQIDLLGTAAMMFQLNMQIK
jgi:hypothetical protein